jgi:polysaccharide export outer membrane protein
LRASIRGFSFLGREDAVMSTKRWNRLFVLLAGLSLLALGAGTSGAKALKIPADQLPPPQPSAPESLAYYVDELPYRIAPGDQLSVDFGAVLDGKPIRTEGLIVRPDGMITLNPIGDVRAAGRTPGELDSVLTRQYVDVFREPNITVTVSHLAGNYVHVLGQVRNPGSYEVLPNATVLQAVVRAGGPAMNASMGSVVLMRRTGPSSMAIRKVSLDRAIHAGHTSQDPYVRRFDIIFVPRTTIGNVNQFVDQFFGNISKVSQAYIFGWEAFNIDRVFPITDDAPRP